MNNSPKIIKLDIEEFDLESGVDMISLVESPAIELPFMYFKSQLEEETELRIEAAMDLIEYIDGLPVYITKEEAEDIASTIGCKGSHTHEIDDGIILYMPCEEHDEAIDNLLEDIQDIYKSRKKKKNYIQNLPEDRQQKIIDKLLEVGESRESLEKQGWVIEEMSEDGQEEFAIT